MRIDLWLPDNVVSSLPFMIRKKRKQSKRWSSSLRDKLLITQDSLHPACLGKKRPKNYLLLRSTDHTRETSTILCYRYLAFSLLAFSYSSLKCLISSNSSADDSSFVTSLRNFKIVASRNGEKAR